MSLWAKSKKVPNRYSLFCSGVLLSSQYIATASHCLQQCGKLDRSVDRCTKRRRPNQVLVLFGEGIQGGKITKSPKEMKELGFLPIESFTAHGEFKWHEEYYFKYDIGLIKLKIPLSHLDDKTIPVIDDKQLQELNPSSIAGFYTLGYGVEENLSTGKKLGRGILHSQYFNIQKSSERFSYEVIEQNHELVLTDYLQKKVVCKGDSGGPVFLKLKNNKYFLMGVNTDSDSLFYPGKTPDYTFKGKCGNPAKSIVLPFVQEWINSKLPNL